MIRQLVAACFVIVSSIPSAAQSHYIEARVVTLPGDTLQGYVAYREWTRTPASFSFKQTPDAKSRDYTVASASRVMIGSYKPYQRFVVPLSMNEVNFSRFDPAISVVDVTDTVFLKVIATGERLNLYAYRDKLKERFYVLVPPATTPVELRRSIEMIDDKIVDLNTYREQLDGIAAGHPAYAAQLKSEIAAAPYAEAGLEKIVNRINGVEEATASVAPSIKYKRGRFFAGAGINATRITYSGRNILNANGLDGNGNPAYKSETVTQSFLPAVSAGYDVFFHPSVARSFLRTELGATAVRSSVNSFYKFPAPYDEELTINYGFSGVFITLTPQLGYALYHQPKLSLNVSAGPSLRYAFYPKQTFEQDTNKEGPGYSDITNDDYFEFKTWAVVPKAQAEVLINRTIGISVSWFGTARLVNNNNHSEQSSLKSASLHLGAVYFFK